MNAGGGGRRRKREWTGSEEIIQERAEQKRMGGSGVDSVVQVYCPAEGVGAGRQMKPAGIWYTPEIAYRSRSQYSGGPERGLRIF